MGAYGDDGSGGAYSSWSDYGAVYLISFSDTSFSGAAVTATIGSGYSGGSNVANASLGTSDYFGHSVSLDSDGDRLAVGAYGDDGYNNGYTGSGAVYLYSFGNTSFGSGSLSVTIGRGYIGSNIDNSNINNNDQFGYAVALDGDGDRLAISALADDGYSDGRSDSGGVYLYTFTNTSFSGGALASRIGHGYGADSGVQDIHQHLDTSDGFGSAVALDGDGDRLAVGAYGDDGAAGG